MLRRWRAGPGALLGLGLGLLALGPALTRGFLLSYDMVFVPHEPVSAALAGLSSGPPRAVPSDLIVAVLSRAVPADIVQKLLLLAVFALACSGVVALLDREPWLARLAAGVFYTWNPFVAERLLIGQWALLLGYAGLPWVVRAGLRLRPLPGRGAARLGLAMLPAAAGGFAAMCVTGLTLLPVALVARPPETVPDTADPAAPAGGGGLGPPQAPTPSVARVARGRVAPAGALGVGGERAAPAGTRGRSGSAGRPGAARGRVAPAGVALGLLGVGSLPWLVPSLLHPVYADPAGGALFAARADTPFGTLGSLLMLGGAWDSQTVPAGYGGAWSAAWLVAVAAALAGYLRWGRLRWPGLGVAALAGLALACIGLTAAGLSALRAATAFWPGFAVLRDGQQFAAPLALAEAVGVASLVTWWLRAAWQDSARARGAPPVRSASSAAAASAVGSPSSPGRVSAAGRVSGAGGGCSARDTSVARERDYAGVVAGVVALVAPVLLLPGLAWGAAGRLRPVAYPASWLAVARMVNDDPDPGAVLLLPWTAYRSPGWDGGRTVLDPWPRLLSRPVLWNDGGLVGHVQLPPDDQRSRDLTSAVRSGGPLTAALRAAGVRFVIVDAGSPPAGRLAGCRLLTPRRAGAASPVVYRVPPG